MILVTLGWEAPAAHACCRTAFTTWSRVVYCVRSDGCQQERRWLHVLSVGVLTKEVFWRLMFLIMFYLCVRSNASAGMCKKLCLLVRCHWEQFGWLYKRAVSPACSVSKPTQATWNCAVGPIQCREQDNQMNQDAKFGRRMFHRRMFRMQNTPLCTNLIPKILHKSPVFWNTVPVTGQTLRYRQCVETRTVYSPMASFIRPIWVSISSRFSVSIRPAVPHTLFPP